jgi:hypothetical protein
MPSACSFACTKRDNAKASWHRRTNMHFFAAEKYFRFRGIVTLYFCQKNRLIATKTLPHEKSVGEDASDSLDGCP